MKFRRSRVYTALNADELGIGSSVKTPPAIEKQSNEILPSVKEQGEAILKRNLNISVRKGMCICEYASGKEYDLGF